MFQLQNCQIGSLAMLSAHFDFAELYRLLKSDDAYLFAEFARQVPTSSVKAALFGIHDAQGVHNGNTGALRLIRNPEGCLDICLFDDHPMFEKTEDPAFVRLRDMSALMKNVFLNSQTVYDYVHGGNPRDLSRFKGLGLAILSTVEDVTEKGTRLFSHEAAVELYLYLLLHMQAAVLPNKPESLKALKSDLDRLCPISDGQICDKTVIDLFSESEDGHVVLPLRYYAGKQDGKEPMSVIELRNPGNREITVTVEGTVLRRMIPARSSIYGLRAGAALIAFMPRFRLSGDMVMLVQNAALCNVWKERTERIETTVRHPVCWAQSSEFGTFIIDQDGCLDADAAWPDLVPEDRIVSVDAFATDYCMLLSDGSVAGRLAKKGWEGVISVSLGLNGAIAIDKDRRPVLGDGTVISGIRAAQARVRGDRYVCMDEQGRIVTDSQLKIREQVFAVAICDAGYVLALEDCIRLIGFDNSQRKEWPVDGATEIEATGTRIACYDENKERVAFLEW